MKCGFLHGSAVRLSGVDAHDYRGIPPHLLVDDLLDPLALTLFPSVFAVSHTHSSLSISSLLFLCHPVPYTAISLSVSPPVVSFTRGVLAADVSSLLCRLLFQPTRVGRLSLFAHLRPIPFTRLTGDVISDDVGGPAASASRLPMILLLVVCQCNTAGLAMDDEDGFMANEELR